MDEALDKWDSILKKTQNSGVDSGVCFSTSSTFCHILNDYGIRCKPELVESQLGNEKSKRLLISSLKENNFGKFISTLSEIKKEKGNLTTKEDPVCIGMGVGNKKDQFHFVMNLVDQSEIVDLTLKHIKRPKWGIDCDNYWAKYNKKTEDVFLSDDIWRRSGCVLYSLKKKTPAEIGVNPERLRRQETMLRKFIDSSIEKRNIPIFMGRRR